MEAGRREQYGSEEGPWDNSVEREGTCAVSKVGDAQDRDDARCVNSEE